MAFLGLIKSNWYPGCYERKLRLVFWQYFLQLFMIPNTSVHNNYSNGRECPTVIIACTNMLKFAAV